MGIPIEEPEEHKALDAVVGTANQLNLRVNRRSRETLQLIGESQVIDVTVEGNELELSIDVEGDPVGMEVLMRAAHDIVQEAPVDFRITRPGEIEIARRSELVLLHQFGGPDIVEPSRMRADIGLLNDWGSWVTAALEGDPIVPPPPPKPPA